MTPAMRSPVSSMAQNLKFKNKTRPQFEPIDEPPKPLPRMSFRDFVCKAYPRYQWYKHCEVMAAALQRVADGDLNRLMVFMPPRHGKSQLVSRLFPAYLLHQHQDKWVGMNCYGADLAYGFSRNSREFYTRAGGELSDDAAAVKFWQTRGEGGLWAAGVGGAITGRGFHVGAIDDPLKNAEEATSTTIREKHKSWYESTFYTREEPGGAIVLIMTRWHEDDLAGWLLSQEEVEPEGWHIINFDAIYEGPRLFPETCTVEEDWRKPGEALCPERYDIEKLEKIKAKVGSYFWGALYQQRPSPLEGGLFKRDNWKYYQQLPGRFDRVILSWDMAFKETKGGSFVVGQVWGQVGAEFYLLDQVRDRMDFAATVAAVKAMVAKWPNASAKLVEDKANGSAVISHLRREVPGLVAVQPKGGKEVRAVAVSPYVEAGNVYLPVPQLAPWIGDYVDEFARFPNAGVDAQVDATTQALTYLNDSQPQGNKRRYGTVSGQNW